MGGSGYLYLHYWPPVDWEPAINVDMVKITISTLIAGSQSTGGQ